MIESTTSVDYSNLINLAILFAGIVVGGLIAHFIITSLLRWVLKHTSVKEDSIIFGVIKKATFLWLALIGIYISTYFLALSSKTTRYLYNALIIIFVLSLTITLVRIGTRIVEMYSGSSNLPSLAIFKNIIRVTILIVGIISILALLGVPITPTLTALGVGGLALSLAMQDTLTNLISGIQIVVDKQVTTGHYVRLSTGEEGYVIEISWRTTQIRQISNNVIIVPNSVLSTAIITNFYKPETELSVLFDVGVSYDSDLDYVEEVTIDVAREVMQHIEGGVPTHDPFIRYNTFDNSSINFTVILRGQEFVDQYRIKHEFVKRLHKRYRQERIEIPFPIRTIYMKNGKPDAPDAPDAFSPDMYPIAERPSEQQSS